MPKSTKNKTEVPSDEVLVAAITAIRAENPTMGREKLKAAILQKNKDWDLSGRRFKQLLRDHHLDTEAAQKQHEVYSSKYVYQNLCIISSFILTATSDREINPSKNPSSQRSRITEIASVNSS